MINYKNKYIKYKTKYLEQNGGQYLDNIKIIKTLGTGMHGTVYLVKNKKNKKEYAMKVEQIMEKDMKESSASPVWREIDFAKTMATNPLRGWLCQASKLATKIVINLSKLALSSIIALRASERVGMVIHL